ncbi:hypothetical protein J4E81_001877 [Alternaria sp. BMP 2799]|nr:hypothetical protein J4E81_001877 [Alternaria sp. BMP 2799]
MARLDGGIVYELGYRRGPELPEIPCYSNKYFIAKQIADLKQDPERFWYCQDVFLTDELELEDYKQADGGFEPFREDVANGRDVNGGWISKGIQEEYAQVVLGKAPREKAITEKDELELSNGIMSMGISDKAAGLGSMVTGVVTGWLS